MTPDTVLIGKVTIIDGPGACDLCDNLHGFVRHGSGPGSAAVRFKVVASMSARLSAYIQHPETGLDPLNLIRAPEAVQARVQLEQAQMLTKADGLHWWLAGRVVRDSGRWWGDCKITFNSYTHTGEMFLYQMAPLPD